MGSTPLEWKMARDRQTYAKVAGSPAPPRHPLVQQQQQLREMAMRQQQPWQEGQSQHMEVPGGGGAEGPGPTQVRSAEWACAVELCCSKLCMPQQGQSGHMVCSAGQGDLSQVRYGDGLGLRSVKAVSKDSLGGSSAARAHTVGTARPVLTFLGLQRWLLCRLWAQSSCSRHKPWPNSVHKASAKQWRSSALLLPGSWSLSVCQWASALDSDLLGNC